MTAIHATQTGTIRNGGGLVNVNVAFCGARNSANKMPLAFTTDAAEVTCKRCLNKRAAVATPEQAAAKKAEREAKEAAELAAWKIKFAAAQAKNARKA